MKYILPTLLAATLAVAAPTNNTLVKRDFQGSINWFKRWDCTNDCVEIGMCLSGQTHRGTSDSRDPWIGWDSGCWDKPDGINSVAVSVDNGHQFKGISKTCEQWKKDDFVADSWHLDTQNGYGDGNCNTFKHDKIKAVVYNW
ncbi:hypothetical protein LTR37_017863 [Vermiconidia calcicola]|uniref:Uncharacterized protein n=1 Tax=Vermiconidia calcicola TaxID=1690605 RepID=A0ACC3MIS8_9PEZI|nr:hypothetical protein LTR37_017863 [Vermiconidia calcicola]